jgi:hypothetical protein
MAKLANDIADVPGLFGLGVLSCLLILCIEEPIDTRDCYAGTNSSN